MTEVPYYSIQDLITQHEMEAVLPTLPPFLPEIKSIDIAALRIDGAYQRALTRRSVSTARELAMSFDTAKFGVPLVMPRKGGLFDIIDGQHRIMAAALRGVRSVPCEVIAHREPVEVARLFERLNTVRTPLTGVALFKAKYQSADPYAVRLFDHVGESDVRPLLYQVSTRGLRVPSTCCWRALEKAHNKLLKPIFLQMLNSCARPKGPLSVGAREIQMTTDFLCDDLSKGVTLETLRAVKSAPGALEALCAAVTRHRYESGDTMSDSNSVVMWRAVDAFDADVPA